MFKVGVILALAFSFTPTTQVGSQWEPAKAGYQRQQKDVQTVRKVEYEWARAYANRDIAALNCILADDFEIAAMPDKKDEVNNKQHVLDWVKTRSGSDEIDHVQVRIVGEAAIARGIYTVKGTDGKVKSRFQFFDIFTYRSKRWQAISREIAELPLD
jgi:ketosteroid isomerase-like protein